MKDMAIAKLDKELKELKSGDNKIRALLPQLDDVTRARVAGVLKQTLQEVG